MGLGDMVLGGMVLGGMVLGGRVLEVEDCSSVLLISHSQLPSAHNKIQLVRVMPILVWLDSRDSY